MKLSDVRTWVFDLDNTLYPARDLYDEIGERMSAYIARTCGVDAVQALHLREHYFHHYGATIVGLVRHHGVDAGDFLANVHDADLSVLTPDAELKTLIARLPGRRIVFTNGGGGHAQRVLARLDLAGVIDAVFDLEDAGLVPKPQYGAYEKLLARYKIDPSRALLIEDTLRNLEPARALGLGTALVGPVHPEPRPAYVHHYAHDVNALLHLALTGETR